MKMDWSKNDFSKAWVEDKVWDLGKGWGTIACIVPNAKYPVTVQFDDLEIVTYMIDGRCFEADKIPSLFWNEIHFDIPEPPKRKIKKPVEHWVGYHYDGSIFDWAYTEKQAQDLKELGYVVRHYIDEFEVEE